MRGTTTLAPMSTRLDPATVGVLCCALGGLVVAGVLAGQGGAAATRTVPVATAPAIEATAAPGPVETADGDGTGAMDRAAGASAEQVDGLVHASRPQAPRAAAEWVARTAAATGIPAPAMRAYADATLAAEVSSPACHVGWTTLAALGLVESAHGTYGGSVLGPDGRSTPAVVGPALDGVGLAAIPATEEGTRLHGDPTWEHAVGPLQFLPSTWQRWAADGDGDGVADPRDLDDAARAAAAYLCAGGRDLATSEGWSAAIFSYNRSEAYVRDVLADADGYAADVASSGP